MRLVQFPQILLLLLNLVSVSQSSNAELIQQLDNYAASLSELLHGIPRDFSSHSSEPKMEPKVKLNEFPKESAVSEEVQNFKAALKTSDSAVSSLSPLHIDWMKRDLHKRATNSSSNSTSPSTDGKGVCSKLGIEVVENVNMYNCSNASVFEADVLAESDKWIVCKFCKNAKNASSIPGNEKEFPANTTLASSPDCLNNCCNFAFSAMNKTCQCPKDRKGRNCQVASKFTCAIEMTSPALPCSAFDAPITLIENIYTSKECRRFSLTDEDVQLTFRLRCKQNTPVSVGPTDTFQYFLKENENLVMSRDPEASMVLRVFNFQYLSDLSQSNFSEKLKPEFYVGRGEHTFSLNISRLYQMTSSAEPANYFIGGRLYLEVSLAAEKRIDGLSYVPYYRTFLDFDEFAPKVQNEIFGDLWPLYIVLILLLLGSIAGFIYYRWRKRRGLREKSKVA